MKGAKNISGATNQTYSATVSATYKVTVTNSSGCSKTSAGAKVTISCREELADAGSTTSLSLYPNPTNGKFSIDLNLNNSSDEEASITIIDEFGKTIYSAKELTTGGVLKKDIILDSSTPGGIYLVKILAGDQMRIGQLIYSK